MPLSSAVDGFRLAYDRTGSGAPVVLLHGWPGDRTDFRDIVPRLAASADVVVPDLRGFGESDKRDRPARGTSSRWRRRLSSQRPSSSTVIDHAAAGGESPAGQESEPP